MSFYNRSQLRKKVSELLVIRASGYGLDRLRKYPKWELPNKKLKRLMEEGVGGVILYGGTVQDIHQRCKQLEGWSNKKILLCADVEEGVGQRFQGGTWFLPPMALGLLYSIHPTEAIVYAKEYGRFLGQQARLCGLNWALAPVCDVNSNPQNPVINMRAWGEDPNSVANLVCAFNKGLVSQGVLSCAKHFPGHGDTSIDSHFSLPILENDLVSLEKKELIPFRALIDQGVNSVMTAHLLLKNIDSKLPATLSPLIISNLLREKMGYKGLIVTDALVMSSISKEYSTAEASVMAFEAGADLIMMPENPDEAIDAILDAIITGRITQERLQESLERRNHELEKLNQYKDNSFKDEFDLNHLESKDAIAFSKKLASLSISQKNTSRISKIDNGINLISVDNLINNQFINELSPAITLPEEFGFKTIIDHPLGVPIVNKESKSPLKIDLFNNKKIILQVFIRGNPFVGDTFNQEVWIQVIKQLQANRQLCALLIYGSCYVWDHLSKVLEPSIPAFYSPGQMPLAQASLLEELFNLKTSYPLHNKYDKLQSNFTN